MDIFLNDKHKIVFLQSPVHDFRFLSIQEEQACVLYVLDMDSHNLQVSSLETCLRKFVCMFSCMTLLVLIVLSTDLVTHNSCPKPN